MSASNSASFGDKIESKMRMTCTSVYRAPVPHGNEGQRQKARVEWLTTKRLGGECEIASSSWVGNVSAKESKLIRKLLTARSLFILGVHGK